MKLKVGDLVKVIAGKDKDKTGKIIKTLKNENKVIVEGVNIHKRHVKPNQMNQAGGIFESEAPIHASNVKKVDKKENKKDAKEVKIEKNTKTTAKKPAAKTSKKKAS